MRRNARALDGGDRAGADPKARKDPGEHAHRIRVRIAGRTARALGFPDAGRDQPAGFGAVRRSRGGGGGAGREGKSLEKSYARLAAELAKREGAELYASTAADAEGIRKVTQRGPIDDVTRARAQAFVAGSKAVFLAISENPPSVLLAASADSGVHAGERVKAAVTAAGGRGGGNPTLAQGSVPGTEALDRIVKLLA